MTAVQHSRIIIFEELTCGSCGIAFAVDAQVRRRWQRTGEYFYCPNGHYVHYTETGVQRLQKQLETERKALEAQKRLTEFAKNNAAAERLAREHTERQLRTRKGINTRLRNRIKHGVCLCCKRSFTNLRRHMQTKHPHFNKDDGE